MPEGCYTAVGESVTSVESARLTRIGVYVRGKATGRDAWQGGVLDEAGEGGY